MKPAGIASIPGRLILATVTLACLVGSYFLMHQGLSELTEARQTERLPVTPLTALAEGPYLIQSDVSSALGTEPTPYARTPAVYVRYTLEEEYQDSDGDTRVRTLESGRRGLPFQATDETGAIIIDPTDALSEVEWHLDRTYRRQDGDLIYSEWALRPGDRIHAIALSGARGETLRFHGLTPFNLPPLISTRALDQLGGDRLFGAGLRISIATALLALGLALGLIALKVHRFWVYVVACTLLVSGTLSVLAVTRMSQEWAAILSIYEGRYQQLQQTQSSPLQRVDVAALAQLISNRTAGWLDHWMYEQAVEQRLPVPDLGPQEAELLHQRVEQRVPARYEHIRTGYVLATVSAALGLILMVFAIRAVKLKRLIEAVPTSDSQGLSFGLSELKARITTDEDYPPLRDPLNQEACVAFDYKVEAKRGSGKNERWSTVEHRSNRVPFWLADPQGKVLTYPEGARIEYTRTRTSRRGNRRYTSRLLQDQADVYCLGFAGLDAHQPDRLSIQKDAGTPFLISGKGEDHLVLNRGAQGFAGIAASLGLFLFTATTLMASDGSFSPGNLLLSALIVPLVLCLYATVLHYNDLVFLRNRVNRARANIDTVLQKRHDLWPAVENLAKASMSHEKALMTTLAEMRTQPKASMASTRTVEQVIKGEQQATSKLLATLEDYPDLKNHELIQQFMEIMSDTENYLSLLRNSYTESVMIYNSRIAVVPDLILARLFRFTPSPQFTQTTGNPQTTD